MPLPARMRRGGDAGGCAAVGRIWLVTASPARRNWPVFKNGSSGEGVQTIQYLLTAAGFGVTVDGGFGPATEARVEEFQAAEGLGVDGIVGGQTWERLVVQLRQDARGVAVKALQGQLNAQGYKVDADGIFGAETEAAVRRFQAAKGLPPTGTVGAATWCVLVGGTLG